MWDYGGGEGPDGLTLFLEKSNAELLVASHDHSRSWWPKLFEVHSEIAFDDYEKDFTDLPAAVRREHARSR